MCGIGIKTSGGHGPFERGLHARDAFVLRTRKHKACQHGFTLAAEARRGVPARAASSGRRSGSCGARKGGQRRLATRRRVDERAEHYKTHSSHSTTVPWMEKKGRPTLVSAHERERERERA